MGGREGGGKEEEEREGRGRGEEGGGRERWMVGDGGTDERHTHRTRLPHT